jgi:hypothetical protein
MTVAPVHVFDEVIDFLLSRPTPKEIMEFHPSEATQERIRTLLEENRNGTINTEGNRELDEFMRVEHFVRMLKIRAEQKLMQE